MYEVWSERLVTQDGMNQGPPVEGHRAEVWGDGNVTMRLLGADMLHVRIADSAGAGVKVSDMRAALDDLERISPFYERSSEDGEVAERVASCVERVCEELPDRHNLLRIELRTTTLQLIERATRPQARDTLAGEA